MSSHVDVLVGTTLVAGFVLFLTGAVGWRREYEQPLANALPVIHRDRGRRAWIHLWMIPALVVTAAGTAGLAVLLDDPLATALAAIGATVYALGAVSLVVSLAFRLTVVPWAAERTVADERVPDVFPPLDAWAGALYVVHMSASYAAFVLLGGAVLADQVLPSWWGWVGVALGAGLLVGFLGTRAAGPFSPPILAHLYTGLLGLLILLR